MKLVVAALAVLMTAGAVEAGAQRLLHAGAWWAALERPSGVCEAVARSELVSPPGRPQPRAAFAYSRDGKRRGELHLLFARAVRPGAAAVLTVGSESFLLVTRGTGAWSRGPRQEAAIIAAVRRSSEMRVRAQGQGGRISDRYLLAGAPTAIDAAAIACAQAQASETLSLEKSAELATWPLSHERRYQPDADPRAGGSCSCPPRARGQR